MIRSLFGHSRMLAYFNTHPWPDAALVLGIIVIAGLIVMFVGKPDQ